MNAMLREIRDTVPKVSEEELKDTSKRGLVTDKEKDWTDLKTTWDQFVE